MFCKNMLSFFVVHIKIILCAAFSNLNNRKVGVIMFFSKDKKDFIWAIVSFLFFTFIFTFSVLPFYYGMLLGAFIALFMLIKSEKPQNQTKQKCVKQNQKSVLSFPIPFSVM